MPPVPLDIFLRLLPICDLYRLGRHPLGLLDYKLEQHVHLSCQFASRVSLPNSWLKVIKLALSALLHRGPARLTRRDPKL